MSAPSDARRLSSSVTWMTKYAFPIVWFGSLAVFEAAALIGGVTERHPLPGARGLMPVILPVFMGAIGYFVFRTLLADLVDEVIDEGQTLLVRNRGREDRIALADVVNVNHSQLSNPERITLQLRYESAFGHKITFTPRTRIWRFSTNPIAADLIERVDAARRRRG
jgi:hypothetical protein